MEKGPRLDIDAAVPFPFCIYDVSKAGDVFIYRPYHIAAVRHPVGTDIPRFRIYELWYPVEYVRTCGYDFKAGKACEKTALVAKHAKATLNVSPFSGSDIAPIKIAFKVAITDEYEYGTFNYDTAAFTKAA